MTENQQNEVPTLAAENMAPLQPQVDYTDRIYKALRLVPEFDGNSNVLIRFLNICDQLVLTYVNPAPGNELNNYAMLNGILNKVKGPAARTLATNGVASDWNGIRNALINSFSDHRDESALYTDLSMLCQGNDTPHVYYERVQNLLNTIMTYVELHDEVSTTVEAKRTLYKKLALQTYLKGLKEPLGSRIRCMRPPTLEKALEFAQEELNVMYLQNKEPRKFPPVYSQNASRSNPTQFLVPRPAFVPQMPPPNVTRPIYSLQQPNTPNRPPYQGPSRTQQMFGALPRSDMSTGFKIQPRPQPMNSFQNRPTPMSGVSHPVARTLPPISRNVAPYQPQREMHSNEAYETYDPNTYDDYNQEYPEYPGFVSNDCDNPQMTDPQQLDYDQTQQTEQDFPPDSKPNSPE